MQDALRIYQQSFRDSTDTIVITNNKGEIIDANPAWLKLYGYTLEEVLGKTTHIIRGACTNDSLYKDMWEEIRDQEKGFWTGEIVNRKKNGEEIPILLTITPIRSNGAIIGYMGIGIDITEQKKFENFKAKIGHQKIFSAKLTPSEYL